MLSAKTEDQRLVKLLFLLGHKAELKWHPDILVLTPNPKLQSAPKVITISTVITSACTDHNFISEQGLLSVFCYLQWTHRTTCKKIFLKGFCIVYMTAVLIINLWKRIKEYLSADWWPILYFCIFLKRTECSSPLTWKLISDLATLELAQLALWKSNNPFYPPALGFSCFWGGGVWPFHTA